MKGLSFLDIRQSSGYTNIPGIWMIWVMMNHDQPDQWSLFRLRIQATNGPKNHQGKRLKSLNVACFFSGNQVKENETVCFKITMVKPKVTWFFWAFKAGINGPP